jgi:hypothetical protein
VVIKAKKEKEKKCSKKYRLKAKSQLLRNNFMSSGLLQGKTACFLGFEVRICTRTGAANKQIAAELLILVFIEIGLAHNHLGD